MSTFLRPPRSCLELLMLGPGWLAWHHYVTVQLPAPRRNDREVPMNYARMGGSSV